MDPYPRRPAVAVVGVLAAALAAAAGVAVGPAAWAHEEREVAFPDGSGSVPTYRSDGPRLLVCKTDRTDFHRRVSGFSPAVRARNLALFEQCLQSGFRHLQEAVDAASAGTNILVLPGVYREEPSLAPPSGECADLDAPWVDSGGSGKDANDRHRASYQILSFEQQVSCPHNQNLVAVLGKHDLQIEGTGEHPTDVVVDAAYRRLNGIRADRADGFYLRNLTVQRTTFNAVYVLQTDGFVIDTVLARWSDEYGFLSFANDHGLFTNCEGYGAGDAAIYPGSASDINRHAGHEVERYAIEITGCYAHHNLLGYSGTAGNSVWAHDNVFTENAAGVAMDSAFLGHPGMPQNHALFEHNVIGDNNQDYYRYVRDGTCLRPVEERGYEHGVVCPAVGLPVGTGVINPGGNYNTWRENWVYGHEYAGFVTSWVPGFVRGETSLAGQFDTSHHNRYLGNRMGLTPDGEVRPNRIDFWWDGQGRGSCWDNGDGVVSEPLALPRCGSDGLPAGLPVARYVAEPAKLMKLYVCAEYSRDDQFMPANCDWYGAGGLERLEVQVAAGEAVLVGLLTLALWARQARRWRAGLAGALVGVAGLAVGVVGTAQEAGPLLPVGLGLWGAGAVLLGLAVRRSGDRGLGWLTVAVGVFALLGAVDRGLTMIPYLPVPPSVVRIAIELVWVPWAGLAVVLARRDRPEAASDGAGEPVQPRPVPEPAG
ncbi:MAG: right-handed parallel beta-helix repeat-containing protein [Micromonosporaceae bacterium]